MSSSFNKKSSFNNKKVLNELDDALVEFLADIQVAFRILNLESFKKLIDIASSGKLDVKSDRFYSKLVAEKADDIKNKPKRLTSRDKIEPVDLSQLLRSVDCPS